MSSELAREKASGLGRTGQLLEEAIDRLKVLRRSIDTLRATDRDEAIAEYSTVRKRALELRWYLEVQREAMGLRRHTDLEQFFPIPGPLTA
jgi:hypothetical protein